MCDTFSEDGLGLDFRKDLKRGSNFKPLLFIVQHLNMQILMMYQLGSSWSMPIQRKPHFSAKGKLQLCLRVALPFIFAEAFVTIYALIYALQNVGQHIWLLSRKYWLALMRSWSSGCWAWESTFLQQTIWGFFSFLISFFNSSKYSLAPFNPLHRFVLLNPQHSSPSGSLRRAMFIAQFVALY